MIQSARPVGGIDACDLSSVASIATDDPPLRAISTSTAVGVESSYQRFEENYDAFPRNLPLTDQH
jgi:hypothetical protein